MVVDFVGGVVIREAGSLCCRYWWCRRALGVYIELVVGGDAVANDGMHGEPAAVLALRRKVGR